MNDVTPFGDSTTIRLLEPGRFAAGTCRAERGGCDEPGNLKA